VTATQVRVTRTSPAFLLPLVLIIILLGVALALASVAPSRVTGGIYQVIVGEGPARFTIPTESLSCNRTGDLARCTVPVAGTPLAITIQYAGFTSSCRAEHGNRMVPCTSGLGDIGQASNTVWISESLGATERDRAPLPWWRTATGPTRAALALIAALAVAAGLASYLLSRRTGELPMRTPAALGIGALGLFLLAASGVILSADRAVSWAPLISPPALVAAAALGIWQYQLGGVSTRRANGIGAALAAATYTAAAAYVFLLHGGFIG
jgi:hypothetical protein